MRRFAAVLILIVARAAFAEDVGATIEGNVVLYHGATRPESPVGGALIEIESRLHRFTAVSALDGTYIIDNVPPGDYWIRVSANEGTNGGRLVVFPRDRHLVRRIFLAKPGCSIWTGYVRNWITGEPIPFALVWFVGSDRTDRNGFFAIKRGCWDIGQRPFGTTSYGVSHPLYIGYGGLSRSENSWTPNMSEILLAPAERVRKDERPREP